MMTAKETISMRSNLHGDDQYKLTSKPTGLCVIMNNENFHKSQLARAGANQDAVDLARTFSWLGFRVLLYKDHTKIQMEVTLKLLSSLENPGELVRYREDMIWEWIGDEFTNTNINDDDLPQHGDAFVCCIMSHGDKGGVFGTDMGRLSIDDITATFSGDKCPLLNQKPKVFFIEAYQKEMEGQPGGQAGSLGVKQAEDDGVPSCMVVEAKADILVAIATVENHVARRHAINGAWFVQCLCKRLRELCPRGKDLMTILCKVNDDVVKKGPMVEAKTTLRKNLVFAPETVYAEMQLSQVWSAFQQKVSAPVLIDLIVDLLEDGTWTKEDRRRMLKTCTTPSQRARMLIDTVLKKGEKACFKMIIHLKIRDYELYSDLGLSSDLPAMTEEAQMAPSLGQDITEKQLLQVARQLGKEWRPLGVHLGLSSSDLKEIDKEHDPTMQHLMVLLKWRDRQRSEEATSHHLWKLLKDLDDLPSEVLQTLEGIKLSQVWSPFIQTLSAPVLIDLMDDLSKVEIFTDEEKCNKNWILGTRTKTSEIACMLVEILQSKGEKASRQMMSYLNIKDPERYSKLGLSSDLPAIPGSSSFPQEGQTGATTSVLPDATKEEKAMKTEMQSVKGSSNEEEEEDSEHWMLEMMDMLKIESDEEELMEPDPDDSDNDEVYRRSCCERCQHVQQSYGSKKITPKKLSRGRYQAQLEPEGTYECVLTGLIFDASERVVVRYSVLPWSKFVRFLQNPWMIAGPTFNVETVPKNDSAIKFIQFPHSLCLAGLVDEENGERVFGVLHITGNAPVIEPSVEFSGSHVKWSVSSLTPLVPTVQKKGVPVVCHGDVLLYKDLNCDDDILILRIYLTPNNSPSHVEAIQKDLLRCTAKRFGRVEKNARTSCQLVESTAYFLTSDQTGVEIFPEDHMFTLKVNLGCFEVQYEDPPCNKFKLQLQLKASVTDDKAAWCTKLLKGDLDQYTEIQPSKRNTDDLVPSTKTRPSKRTHTSEEVIPSKRSCLLQDPGMTAKQLIKTHKTRLQEILAAEITYVIQWVFEAKLVVEFQYDDLKNISPPSKAAIGLVDKILSKGETTCRAFLSLLQEDKLTELFPDLKTLPLYIPPAVVSTEATTSYSEVREMDMEEGED